MQGEKGNEPCIIVAIRRDGKDLAWVIRDDTVLMLVRDRGKCFAGRVSSDTTT